MLREIRAGERFALVSHEHPDGDALGSLVAMQAVLRALGKDSVMVIAPEEFPLPQEYRFFALDGLFTEPPADLDERTVMFLDCGNLDGSRSRRCVTPRRSSTSTITTTTPASAPSTTSSRTPPAPPSSSGTSAASGSS